MTTQPRYTIEPYAGREVIWDHVADRIVEVEYWRNGVIERLCAGLNDAWQRVQEYRGSNTKPLDTSRA